MQKINMKQLIARKSDRDRFLTELEVRPPRGGPPFPAHALDLGPWGLGLFARRFVDVGNPVELVFRKPGASSSADELRILGTVVNVRIETDGNMLGVAFSRALDTNEMNSLKSILGSRLRR